MSYQQGSFPIVKKEQLSADVFSLTVRTPLAAQTCAGQFVHLRAQGFSLRRPISVCDFEEDRMRLVFQTRGAGTAALAALEEGALLDVLGPLGNGFPKLPPQAKVILVGGGIGTPPMLALARRYGKKATALLGFRGRDAVILEKDFAACCDTQIATDDGSYAYHGFVTQLLQKRLKSGADMIFACGPMGMLKGVVALAESIPCKVSLEERMACGVGACLVCACKTVRDGKEIFSHVCSDGPVFDSGEVVFE